MGILLLPLSWWSVGALASLAGFGGFFYPFLSVLLILPLLVLGSQLRQVMKPHLLSLFLLMIWASHLIQVFVPETGFDAVWYHLPVARSVTLAHRFSYDPLLYQSTNPLFSDAVFYLGYQLWGDVGAKLVAYLFGISLMITSYQLARFFLPKNWSLLAVLLISTFQVVAWQSASFYVDVAKAFWEISAVLALCLVQQKTLQSRSKRQWLLAWSAIFVGASLATKVFSLLLLPVFGLLWFFSIQNLTGTKQLKIQSNKKAILATSVLIATALVVALPYYVFSYVSTGQWFYSVGEHVRKLDTIGGEASPLFYVLQRFIYLPSSLWIFMTARDYVSPLLVFLSGYIVWNQTFMRASKKLLLMSSDWVLIVFSLAQWLIWWFVPPLSTRYTLAGFITLTIFLMRISQKTQTRQYLRYLFGVILLVALLQCVPRLVVNARSLRYLSGRQTKQEYLYQFYDGWIDKVLSDWHGL